jgi:heat shock protein HspQ
MITETASLRTGIAVKYQSSRFSVGQLVQHKLFDYRGVVVDVDPCFMGTEEWYEQMARTRPPREAPWYRVLVHDAGHETYVAERNLEEDDSLAPIRHPLVEDYFGDFRDGQYIPHQPMN